MGELKQYECSKSITPNMVKRWYEEKDLVTGIKIKMYVY